MSEHTHWHRYDDSAHIHARYYMDGDERHHFVASAEIIYGVWEDGSWTPMPQEGMSLRDRIAIGALQGMLASGHVDTQ